MSADEVAGRRRANLLVWCEANDVDDDAMRETCVSFYGDDTDFDDPPRFCVVERCTYSDDVICTFHAEEEDAARTVARLFCDVPDGGWYPDDVVDLDTGETFDMKLSATLKRRAAVRS